MASAYRARHWHEGTDATCIQIFDINRDGKILYIEKKNYTDFITLFYFITN